MGKIKYSIVIICLLCFTVGCSLFTKTWTYRDLPNHYVMKKVSETKMIVGKESDKKPIIELDGKTVGFESYVSEFQKGERFIGFKCASSTDDGVSMSFYLIDTQYEYVHGPYSYESTYETVKDRLVDEDLGEWIKTSTIES